MTKKPMNDAQLFKHNTGLKSHRLCYLVLGVQQGNWSDMYNGKIKVSNQLSSSIRAHLKLSERVLFELVREAERKDAEEKLRTASQNKD